jgi:hypothetical protein
LLRMLTPSNEGSLHEVETPSDNSISVGSFEHERKVKRVMINSRWKDVDFFIIYI